MRFRTVSLEVGGVLLDVLPGTQIVEEDTWLPSISASVIVPATQRRDARLREQAQLVIWDGDGHSGDALILDLAVRRCDTDFRAGTATLTLESSDLITLAHRGKHQSTFGSSMTVLDAVEYVAAEMDPAQKYVSGVVPLGTLPTDSISPLTPSNARLIWTPEMTAADILAEISLRSDTRIRALRDGTWGIAPLDGNITPWADPILVTDDTLITARYSTSQDDYWNGAWGSFTQGGSVIKLKATGPGSVADIGPRYSYTEASTYLSPHAQNQFGERLLRQGLAAGAVWQIEVFDNVALEPGAWLRVDSDQYGIDITQRIKRVAHTHDGIATVDLENPVV